MGTWVWVTLRLTDGGPALERPSVYVGIGVGERVVEEQARALPALILPTTSEVFVRSCARQHQGTVRPKARFLGLSVLMILSSSIPLPMDS